MIKAAWLYVRGKNQNRFTGKSVYLFYKDPGPKSPFRNPIQDRNGFQAAANLPENIMISYHEIDINIRDNILSYIPA
jgi:hypothetical protein